MTTRRRYHLSLDLWFIWTCGALSSVTAAPPTPCEKDSDCHAMQAPESVCGIDGFCSNAFASGCLYQRMPGWTKKRVCNSEDPPDAAAQGICETPQFDYQEVRIMAGNWESITLNAWLMQILLSEILGVPTTLEASIPARNSFFEPSGAFEYGSLDTVQSFENNFKYKGCEKASRDPDNYETCANLSPEFWIATGEWAQEAQQRGLLEPPEALGVLARESLFVPKFTLERDASLLSYIGMQGEKNRQKLADAFLRPTLWKDYCLEVSPNNCSTPDENAQRPPEDDDEGDRFFLKDEYTGYFRKTDANNCTLNPDTCTGHLVDYPCEWSSYAEQQLYHLNISLSGDKHGEGERGHGDWQTVQILNAANHTKSNVIIMWAQPDPFYQRLVGTDMELHAVVMPPVSQECLDHKRGYNDQCSGDMEIRAGDPRGACEDPMTLLHKVFATTLTDELNDPDIIPAEKSPAVPAIQQFSMSSPLYGDWFNVLIQHEALSKETTSLMRNATCNFVVDKFDVLLEKWIPFSYPRVVMDGQENSALIIASVVLACLSTVLAVAAAIVVHKTQHRRVMRYAQIEFLHLMLAGILVISSGALVTAIPPTMGSCVAAIWLVNVGYTMELAPLLVKVAAINRLMNASDRMQKINIERKDLFQVVLAISTGVVIFVIIWTAVDAPEKQAELELSTSLTAANETIVYRSYYCSSESDAWMYVSFSWICVLLFSSSVLAFQMRNVRQEFNESQTLGMLTYSHFLFAILRFIVFFLDELAQSDRAGFLSILLSADSIAALLIYFFPKFLALRDPDVSMRSSSMAIGASRSMSAYPSNNGTNTSGPPSGVSGQLSGPPSDVVSSCVIPLPTSEERMPESFAEEPEHAMKNVGDPAEKTTEGLSEDQVPRATIENTETRDGVKVRFEHEEDVAPTKDVEE